MPSCLSGSKRCSATGTLSQKDSYQYDKNSCMMSILLTWHKRDLNAKNTWQQHEYPINIMTKGSQTKHDESWQQVHPINDSMSHQVAIMKQGRKQDPTSNIKHGSMHHNASHSKRSTWMHWIYLTSWGHMKKRMSNCRSWPYHQSRCIKSHGMTTHTLNVDTCNPIWKLAEK